MFNSKLKAKRLWEKKRYKCQDEDSVTGNIILPVFESIGWNENRGLIRKKDNRDITIQNDNVALIMECKKLNTHEFNVFESIGALKPDGKNYPGDGVGQLRCYCVKYMRDNLHKKIIPIISNGLRWVIFCNSSFLDTYELQNNIKPARDIIFDELLNEKCFIKKLQRKLKSLGLTPKLK